jgi:hypothetical protein
MRPIFLLILGILGCDDPLPPAPTAQPPATPAFPRWSRATGDIVGRVVWAGPPIAPTVVETYRPAPGARADRVARAAPNLPVIDPASGGLAGAIVSLSGVTAAARDWDHPPVSIELHDAEPMIRQGAAPPRSVGLVRRGDDVRIVSRQNIFHALRARGAAFWTFTLPDADRPLIRRLEQPGIVELSSAAGYYWMHAYLLVSEHPYCAVSDSVGRFSLPRVPPGDYELVVWLPAWHVVRRERDPESTAVTRIVFGPHHEWRQPVTVVGDSATDIAITVPR